MGVVGFKCPDGVMVSTEECMNDCRIGRRCVTKATLKLATDRFWDGGVPHVTQLLNGTMMEYLKHRQGYYVDPQDRAFTLLGSTHHKLLENKAVSQQEASAWEIQWGIPSKADVTLGEIHFQNNYVQGTADLLERESGIWTLTDYKTWGSYRVGRALGITVQGRGKDKKIIQDDSAVDMRNEELQLNMYRLGLQEMLNIQIDRMQIQCTVRDGSTFIARNRGIYKNIYLIDVDFLRDSFVEDFFKSRSQMLMESIGGDIVPPVCDEEERWYDRRCKDYCEVAQMCPWGSQLVE